MFGLVPSLARHFPCCWRGGGWTERITNTASTGILKINVVLLLKQYPTLETNILLLKQISYSWNKYPTSLETNIILLKQISYSWNKYPTYLETNILLLKQISYFSWNKYPTLGTNILLLKQISYSWNKYPTLLETNVLLETVLIQSSESSIFLILL